MSGRITTSLNMERKIIELQKVLKLSTKAAVMRLAIGISLNQEEDPRKQQEDNDHNGATYQILTITGEYNDIYKMMFSNFSGYKINEEEFTELLLAHIYRGIEYLYSEYELKGNYNKILDYLIKYI